MILMLLNHLAAICDLDVHAGGLRRAHDALPPSRYMPPSECPHHPIVRFTGFKNESCYGRVSSNTGMLSCLTVREVALRRHPYIAPRINDG